MDKKINTIDLFAGCGGLMDGFEKSNFYDTLACVEWEKSPCENLEKRLKEINPLEITPLEALNILDELKKELKEK